MDEYRDASLYDEKDTGGGTPAGEAETVVLNDTDVLHGASDTAVDGDTGPARQGWNRRRRKIAIASVIAAVVVLAGGAGGYTYAVSNVQKGTDAAQTNAQAVDQKLTERIAEAQELLDDTKKEQVADAQTLTALSDAIGKAQAQSGVDAAGANRWLVWQELDAQTAYDADSADASDALSRLDKAMEAVTGSADAKTLADAKQVLQSAVDNADKTYTDSDGKVQDNATRASLKTALDAAKKVLDDNSMTDVKEYTDQKTAVDNAVKTVNDSITAKEKADAEAAAAASSAAFSGGGGYYGGGYTGSSNNGYTAPSGSTNGGSSASTPAPDTGGDMSFDWVEGDTDFNDNSWY